MYAEHTYVLSPEDFSNAPLQIKFNQAIMREAFIPLGNDDTLRLFLDVASLDKFTINVTITDLNND